MRGRADQLGRRITTGRGLEALVVMAEAICWRYSRVLDAGSVDRMGLSTASTPSAPPLNTQCPSECAFYSPRVFRRRLRTGTLPVLLRVHNPGMPNRNPRVPPADSLRHHHQALQTPPSRDPPTQLVCSSPHPSEHFRPGRLPGSRLRA